MKLQAENLPNPKEGVRIQKTYEMILKSYINIGKND